MTRHLLSNALLTCGSLIIGAVTTALIQFARHLLAQARVSSAEALRVLAAEAIRVAAEEAATLAKAGVTRTATEKLATAVAYMQRRRWTVTEGDATDAIHATLSAEGEGASLGIRTGTVHLPAGFTSTSHNFPL